MLSNPPNQPPNSPARAYVIPIPYGLGVEVLQAVLATWPAEDDRPVLVVTHLAGRDNATRPPQTNPVWDNGVPGDGPRALVRCRQPADLFRLGRCFERALRQRVFSPPAAE